MNRPASKTVRRRFIVAVGHAIHLTWPVLSTILAFQVALGLLIGFIEGWSVGDAVYFTFVTGFTIGYGDIVPRQGLARALAIRSLRALPHWPHSGNCGLRHAHSDRRSRHRLTPVDLAAQRRGRARGRRTQVGSCGPLGRFGAYLRGTSANVAANTPSPTLPLAKSI